MKRIMGAAVATALIVALAPALSAQAANQVISVDLGNSTGAISRGASGFLYGLADEGISSDNTLGPLKATTTYQKAPDGAQHPNGDALKVAPQFLRNGGQTVGVYMQDILTRFPYENPGIEEYGRLVETQARKIVADPNRSKYIYVPFNEPDKIWYEGNLAQLQTDWKYIYQKIRAIDPTARIAGPNYYEYKAADYRSFLQYTRDNNVLPDVTTWHELQDSFFGSWYSNFDSYRASETALGISPRPIAINEYGRFGRTDLSVPGNLVQWITRFENTKVQANLAYWTDAGTLNDLVAENEANKVTGAWWLYKWYGEMTGNTVAVTPPSQNGPLQGVATYDSSKKQARVILGGSLRSDDVFATDVQIRNVPSALGSTVHATVWGVDASGVAPSSGPYVAQEADVQVVNGTATVTIGSMKALSAYQVVLTPNTDLSALSTNRYEAEYADLGGSARVTYNAGGSGYSGTYFSEGYGASNNASTKFVVTVPSDGYYDVALRYAAGPFSGAPTNRVARLTLGDVPTKDVTLAGTANWNTWSTVTTKLYLQGGINRIGVNAFTGDDSDAFNVDYIDVTPANGSTQVIEAEASGNQVSGLAARAQNSGASGGSAVGYIGQGNGNSLTINGIQAATAGDYDVVVQFANFEYSSGGASYNNNSVNRFANISVNGGSTIQQYFRVTGGWSNFKTTVVRVKLNAGTNSITFTNPTAYAPDIDRVTIAAVVG